MTVRCRGFSLISANRSFQLRWIGRLFGVAFALASVAHAKAEDFRSQRDLLVKAYGLQLTGLAAKCREAGNAELATEVAAWIAPHDPTKLYLVALPEAFGENEATAADAAQVAGASPRHDALAKEFADIRTKHGDELFQLARRALKAKDAAAAFQLLLEALREHPDQAEARRMLGYVRSGDRWCTRFEAQKLRGGQIWSPKFGWLSAANLKRYEKGERLFNGKWLSVADEAKRRRDIRSGWKIDTEHYSIRTNHSLEAGVALGVRLERLYAAWQQTFVRYYATQKQLNQFYDGRGLPRVDDARHLIVYYRDQDDYRRGLAGMIPENVETAGIYLNDARTAYFFAPGDVDEETAAASASTLFHEAAHQLFSESRPVAPNIGRQQNFWIVEGIACYFESLGFERGYYTLGGADSQRLQAARFRALEDEFYVPLAELCGFGMLKLQQDPRIARLYSQSAGLAHFLVHFEEGRYRPALINYLGVVYSGRDTPETLTMVTGASFEELDAQYRKFLTWLPTDATATN